MIRANDRRSRPSVLLRSFPGKTANTEGLAPGEGIQVGVSFRTHLDFIVLGPCEGVKQNCCAPSRDLGMAERRFRFLEADSKKRPPNYASRAAQRKLLMLVGGLFVVLIAMQQVGRPEAWQWLEKMGQADKSSVATIEAVVTSDAFQQTVDFDWQGFETAPELSVQDLDHYRGLEELFWKEALARLEPSERFAWVEALAAWIEGQQPVDDQDLVSGLQRLVRLREQFRDEVKRQAAVSQSVEDLSGIPETDDSDSTDRQLPGITQSVGHLFDLPGNVTLEVAQVVEDESRWLLTAMKQIPGVQDATGSESDPSASILGDHWEAKLSTIRAQWIDPVLLEAIEDGTRLGRPEERATWLRLIQMATALSDSEDQTPPEVVTRQNLLGQPEQFRGKPVQVRGTLRRVERKRQTTPEIARYLSADDYLVAWIQPGVAGQGPYCVYCLDDPNLESLLQESDEQRRATQVAGIFYKVFPYATSQTETALAPILVARGLEMRATTVQQPPVPPAPMQWLLIVGGVVLLASVFGGLAWYSTVYRSANPIGQRLYRSGKVEWLDREGVDSVSESLRKMEQQSAADEHSEGGDDANES